MDTQSLAHTVFAICVLAGYVVLSALNKDANVLLGLLVGQGVGAGISKLPSGRKT